MMNKNVKSIADHNARLLNIFSVCQAMIFVLPVLLPYYRDKVGLGFQELMIGEAVFSLVILTCEVPTGWLADHWKRKYVLALAGLSGMIAYTLLLTAHSFAATVVAQGAIGVGVSLVSGTLSAIHYDSLLMENRVGEYRKQEGRRHGLALLSVGASSLLGGFLYEINHDLPVIGTIIADFCLVVTALLMWEPDRLKSGERRNPFVTMGQTMKYALHGHREVAEIIFSAAALFGTTKMLMWAQQPYYIALDLNEKWFGVLMAIGFVVGSTASQLGHLLDHRFRNRTVLFGMLVTVIVICVTSSALHSLAGAVLLLSGSAFWGLGWPRIQDALNACVDSDRRATVLSTCSLMIHVVFVPLSLAVGKISALYGAEAAVLSLAVVPGLAALVLLRVVFREVRKVGTLVL